MLYAKVTNTGKITIPAELRKKYKLTPSRKVKFVIEEEGIKLFPLVKPEDIEVKKGLLGTKFCRFWGRSLLFFL